MLFDHLEEKEAVKMAALIEKNGHRFYMRLAEKAENPETKAIFKKLAHDEVSHLKTIEKGFFPEAGFNAEEITEEEIIIEEYLKRRGISDIFTKRVDVDSIVHVLNDTEKALAFALNTEKHSVEFFGHLARKCTTEEGRKIYSELADEEKIHVAQIEAMLRK